MDIRIVALAALLAIMTPPARAQTMAALDAATFDRYAGHYQMDPKRILAVTRDGARYFLQLGQQPPAEIFPETATHFFLRIVPAQIDFVLDDKGTATAVVLHQNGHDLTMPRISEAQAAAAAAQPHGHPMTVNWPMLPHAAPRFLTSFHDTLDVWPCFSPDGNTILFSRSADGGRTWNLQRISTAGGTPQPFAPGLPVSATRANWSAQGQIAFTGQAADFSNSVWIVAATAAAPVRSPHPACRTRSFIPPGTRTAKAWRWSMAEASASCAWTWRVAGRRRSPIMPGC